MGIVNLETEGTLNSLDDDLALGEGQQNPLARLERIYLAGLRIATLGIATILLGYALWLGVSGLWGISKDADSVEVAEVSVSPDEIAALPVETAEGETEPDAAADDLEAVRRYYGSFLDKYYALYQTRFERFRQADDKVLAKADFDDMFVQTDLRIEQIDGGDLSLGTDRTRLEGLFAAMQAAAQLEVTQKRLAAYKAATKKRVETEVTKYRTERYCDYYGYYMDECISYDTRTVPYTATEVSMELPDGVFGYQDLFGTYQDNYIRTLVERTEQAEQKAGNERSDILMDNEEGSQALGLAIKIAGGFLAIMFFFLLIAIERHQRAAAERRA
ncbi:hypothetical protein A9D14_10160 [Croceicoccus marinus]|uniref:Uncharacterized protein n=1 Tax=Croceicoccus marinus TaxID=450378 RepID=A0A1Z1FCD6_9SPHN|nr:hypothetical protein A9D14_10160 [Croceicoccus marinus]